MPQPPAGDVKQYSRTDKDPRRDEIEEWNPWTGIVEVHERWVWDRIHHDYAWRNNK
jgi:hypothetical protein